MAETLKDIFAQGFKFDENILQAFEKKKLVFFIGAGVSRLMGVKGWSDFSTDLIRKAYPDYQDQSVLLRDISDSKERITIAYEKFAQDDKLEEFYRCFGNALIPDPNTFSQKENIYKILNRFEAFFLTTNADNLFEEVLGSELCHEDFDIARIKGDSQRRLHHLVYLHGHYTEDIDIRNNGLVFTAPQYVKRYNDKSFIDFLKAVFHEDNTIVFIGYGLNEFELIDYIMTKVGSVSSPNRKIYVLHGFCENDDILFKAKQAYFSALNIELIPYDQSHRGYDALIDTLKELLSDYQKRAIVPITDQIHQCISEYNAENYATILRYLKDPVLAHENEPQITHEIRKHDAFTWTKHLYQDGMFSTPYMEEKISYRAWPLLELFVEWVQSDDPEAQDAALVFLNQITPEHIAQTLVFYSHIARGVLRIIFSLNKNNIQPSHFDLVKGISANRDTFLYSFHDLPDINRLPDWDSTLLQRIFDLLFYSEDDKPIKDQNNTYWADAFLDKFIRSIQNERTAQFLFEYVVQIIGDSNQNVWGTFLSTNDLDHIYKDYDEYWEMLLNTIKTAFSKMSDSNKQHYLEKLIHDENISINKLGLYLSRKFDIDISNLICIPALFDSVYTYHELFLLLKHHVTRNLLSISIQEQLCNLICEAKFGIDDSETVGENKAQRRKEIMLSWRLTLLQTLNAPKALFEVDALRSRMVEPYPTEKYADEFDYIHHGSWHNPVQLTQDTFSDLSPECWIEKFSQICTCPDDMFSLQDCGRQFVAVLLEQPDECINRVIPTLETAPTPLVMAILQGFYFSENKIPESIRVMLISMCLVLLDSARRSDPPIKNLASAIFDLLDRLITKLNVKDPDLYEKILFSFGPWMGISLDDRNDDEQAVNINTLINYGNYHKFKVLLNCYVARKQNTSIIVTETEINTLLNVLENADCNDTLKYTLCLHYQNTRYCMEDGSKNLYDWIFAEDTFDIMTLLLSVIQSEYVFAELVKLAKGTYLSGKCSIPDDCDHNLAEHFYVYLMSAYHLKMLSPEEIEKAYAHPAFVNQFLHSVSLWMKKPDFVFDEWIPPCWEYIKNHYDNDKIGEYAATLLHSIEDVNSPTEAILDLYLEVASRCSPKSFFHLDYESVLAFFNINAEKTNQLIYSMLELDTYIEDETLRVIISKYKEIGLEREARALLNMLTKKGGLSVAEKENMAKLLE